MKIFIDGSAGTTGLRIKDRLMKRSDVELITLSEEQRKDTESRKQALNSAQVAFLCLPDAAAVEAVELVENPDTVIIDTSTAHRTSEGWAYGFPELGADFREKIAKSPRTAVPGCYASGFISMAYPLVKLGIMPADYPVSVHAVSGYSGAGKKAIAVYESGDRPAGFDSPRQYALTQQHKHLKEMKGITGIENAPIFCPVVDDFYSGMQVTVPLFAEQISCSSSEIADIYRAKYQGPVVTFCDKSDNDGFLCAGALSGTDGMKISVYGNDERILLTAVYDNLGKGASGAALENLNLVMGKDKAFGLDI